MRFIFVVLCMLPISALGEEQYYRLRGADLACIVENIDIYRGFTSNPVFVETSECPPTEETFILSYLTNEVPKPEFAETEFDGFVALTQTDIDCVAGLSVPENVEVVRLFLDSCTAEAE